jgi:G3E family GTPase
MSLRGGSVSLFDRDKSAERLPVSLITGYLGSGKTTLLNHVLRQPGMGDSAVIVNEFGEVGLDHLLVEGVDPDIAVLASGCICCTVRSDLEATMRGLLARRDRGDVPPFRRILVETTGLADPAPIVQLLLNNPLLSHFVRLDAVLTTVDAINGERQLSEHREAAKQVAVADRLLLTKTDLAPSPAVAGLRRRLGRLNPGATVLEVVQGKVSPDRLFGAGLFDPDAKTPDVRRWINEEAYGAHDPHDDHGHKRGSESRHDAEIRAFCLSFDTPLDWLTVMRWLDGLRQNRGENLLRVKGILNLRVETVPIAIHGVHHVFHPPVALAAWPDDDHRSRIIFITRGIERVEIEESWRETLATA